ncbi:MAG: HNH endonuclease [Methylococcaceae bacterium]
MAQRRDKNLINYILDVFHSHGYDSSYHVDFITEEVKKKGYWENSKAKTPEKSVSSYLSNQHSYLFEKCGDGYYKLKFELNLEEIEKIKTIDEYNQYTENSISKSEKPESPIYPYTKKPKIIEVTQKVYIRNPYVITKTLKRANGICEKCKNPAPFIRASNKTAYLEVHHKIPLSENGDDTIENTIALCPNCHREEHCGQKNFN